jgi:hypothetical protein
MVPSTIKPKNRLGLWAMVAGIVAAVSAFIPGLSFVTWAPAAAAVVLGILAFRAKNAPHGQAISGIVLGPIGFLIAVIVSISFIASLAGTPTAAIDPITTTTQDDAGSSATPHATPSPTVPPTPTTRATPTTPPAPAAPALTLSQQQAVLAAQSYLRMGTGFSRQGLIDQLSSSYGNGFSVAYATAAVN